MTAKLTDIKAEVKKGGLVRMFWGHAPTVLVCADGRVLPIDGRSYQGFLRAFANTLQRSETGSTEAEDLVIEWRS